MLRLSPRIALLLASIAVALVAFSLLVPQFLTPNSLTNLLRQASVLSIVATGATFVIVAGEIDLSVGVVAALVSVLTALASRGDFAIAQIIGYALAVGLAVGLVNGFLVLMLRVPSFLATLGMLLVIKGAAMTISLQPMAVRNIPFIQFFRLSPLGIPMPFLIALVVFAAALLLMRRSSFGVWTRAVGSNEGAARLAGLATARHKYLVLVLGALMAALGGVVLAGRTNYGIAMSATGLELDVIAAVVLGGGRLGGGVGSIVGTLLAALLLTIIFTGVATVGLAGPYQDILKGILIGAAIILMRK